ncbi:GNAT family N-acetyltransferase [Flavivirga spongiicola]|uniref:GNAT family N-acetyltransferase n=1 Tax=Flavivirga spongiicola TaxID=421621 RepID=A0ABU7XWT6_9FLAO|nr:GNAT family N-acetyltransferase [Flavivirga sp. MEBiC05379]MDO5980245.1 GNAT family N-acetyltransferase [Flavivirga sp. MEBiC05379]
MIRKLNHKKEQVSKDIYHVFQASYKIEAKLLQVKFQDFPPLKRTVNEFQDSTTNFYGFWKASKLAAVIEIDKVNNITDICSLVVHPLFFRQGIAKKLLEFAVELYNSEIIIVETGLANKPAIILYEKFGFVLQGKYMTSIGIEKVKFSFHKTH